MSLGRIWLVLLPLLYLPNLGFARRTPFGTLELSDLLIGPYILAVLLAARQAGGRRYHAVLPWLIGLGAVAFVSTATIYIRFPVRSDYAVTFGLLKLAKLSLYGFAGLLTARALSLEAHRPRYDWALLLGASVVALALITMPEETVRVSSATLQSGYKATNAVSATLAMLIVFLVGRALLGAGTRFWRVGATLLLPMITLGFLLSRGRGGWVAAAVGVIYLFYRAGLRRQVLAFLLIGLSTIGWAYAQYPSFQEEVDKTLMPNEAYLERYNAGLLGVDDGARLTTWSHELEKLPRAAVLGTGFFHRGGASALWTTGSHNFWLQMLLETGLVGFGLVTAIGAVMWRQARRAASVDRSLGLPLQAALVTALVAGMSGEYFYGGMVLFTLFAVYAPVGCLPYPEELALQGDMLPTSRVGIEA
jgi:hypothetical protein